MTERETRAAVRRGLGIIGAALAIGVAVVARRTARGEAPPSPPLGRFHTTFPLLGEGQLHTRRKTHAMGRNAYGVLLATLAVGLVVVAGIAVRAAWVSPQVPTHPDIRPQLFDFVLKSISIPDRTAQIQVHQSAGVDPSYFLDFKAVNGQAIAACNATGLLCSLRLPSGDVTVTVRTADDSVVALGYPWQCFGIEHDVACQDRTITIPLVGAPSRYPFDSYRLSADFEIDTGDIGIGRTADTTQIMLVSGSLLSTWSLAGVTTPMVRNVDMAAAMDHTLPHVDSLGAQGFIDFPAIVTRPFSLRLWVLLMSLVPLGFALIFTHVLFLNRESRRRPIEEFFVGLSAAALAVLPLRLVLVPADVQGATLVDALLAFGVATLTALGLSRYASDLWRGRTSGTSSK